MMPGSEQLGPNDAALLRYLLGTLPVDEAEPIEEASIVDENFATRLNAMERDLVDSYVRGELEGSNLAKFQSWYLSSPLRAQKVEAAKAILRIVDASKETAAVNPSPEAIAAPTTTAVADTNAVAGAIPTPAAHSLPQAVTVNVAPKFSYGEDTATRGFSPLRFATSRAWAGIGLGVAVLVMSVTLGYVYSKNKQLRKEVAETKQQSSALTAQLDDQRAADSTKNGAPSGLAHGVENVATVTMFLPTPTRGASTIPKIDVPAGTGLVVLSLGLGANDEDNYRAQLMNPTTNKVLWHSGLLRPGSDGTYLSVAVPANLLRSQIYLIQLMHDAKNGVHELLGSYPFRVEVK
jgi:hypothetical protein